MCHRHREPADEPLAEPLAEAIEEPEEEAETDRKPAVPTPSDD